MTLYIKNMVSNRDKIAVEEVLKKLELQLKYVELGEVEINDFDSEVLFNQLKNNLKDIGFEIIEDKQTVLVERIKNTVIELVYHSNEIVKVKFSYYLSEKLNLDYTYMSNVFTKLQGTTIEQFIITHKVEHIKELIIYNEFNITEIAHMMNYSSVAHLSTQFKKVTGLTPSGFKKLTLRSRYPIETL